jgi:hypothetical protein
MLGLVDVYGRFRGPSLSVTFLATFCKEPVLSRMQRNKTKTDLQEVGRHCVI